MAKIKIISNPYQKETKFQKWNDTEAIWEDIDYECNRNSKLLGKDISNGFFPFCAKKIVDLLISEYGLEGERIELFFEGSIDEYEELDSACSEELYREKVIPKQSKVYLENARDILPEVRNLFKEMSPLIAKSVKQEKIQRDLTRFTDASSDVVPICVLGNYSAGKSTFINALIGNEILPSGTEPVTAKVYKIARSADQDRAIVSCKYLGYDVVLRFTNKDTYFDGELIETELSSALRKALADAEGENIFVRVYKSLSVINGFEADSESPDISDLIEIEIPFTNGVLAHSLHPFVIFDTPGSNSASNARHLQVLKEAMANMTNGLPIFLCTPDSLDSTDNENLYHIISDMEELDSRFTMIVVNKADSAGIQRRGSTLNEQNRILSQAVPRNLYSGGLFYVSSILGLGAKTDGVFEDYVYEDVFDAQVDRYRNPNHKHYRTLYEYNIQPSQLKRKADDKAAKQTDLVYSNSGLFTVEDEIEAFAGKYSAYNKCFQSQRFLTRVIQITAEEIEDKRFECEGIRQSIKDKLEDDKKALIEKLNQTADSCKKDYVDEYPSYMFPFLEKTEHTFSTQELEDKEEEYIRQHEIEQEYETRVEEAKQARAALGENLKSNFLSAIKNLSSETIKGLFSDLQSDYETTRRTKKAQDDAEDLATKNASDSLLKHVAIMYESRMSEIFQELDSQSKEFWTTQTEKLRTLLAGIVTGSDVLTEERRQELEQIIITYQQISFHDDAEAIFDKVQFERKFKIGNLVLWESPHLDIEKLAKTYNDSTNDGATKRYDSIEASHRESAFTWIQNLLDVIFANIVEYNPALSKQAKQIRIMSEQIDELEDRQRRLKQYTEQLRQMMDWKPYNG